MNLFVNKETKKSKEKVIIHFESLEELQEWKATWKLYKMSKEHGNND